MIFIYAMSDASHPDYESTKEAAKVINPASARYESKRIRS